MVWRDTRVGTCFSCPRATNAVMLNGGQNCLPTHSSPFAIIMKTNLLADTYCYVTLSTRRYSWRNLLFHCGHLSLSPDPLRCSGTRGIARSYQNGTIASSFYYRCLGFITRSCTLCLVIAVGRCTLCDALGLNKTDGFFGMRTTLSSDGLDDGIQNQTS